MISHKYKCIFIHIQRTAGTSIEKWISDDDWWRIEDKTKHLLASEAKKIYSDYWDEYFKFSFIRNPWDRMVSSLKFKEHFALELKESKLIIDGYKNKYGYPITIENDPRFSDRKEIINQNHKPNQVYGNIIDEDIDFIGKFENLKDDVNFIKDKLQIKEEFNVHLAKSSNRNGYREYYDEKSYNDVYELYKNDIDKYNYTF